MVHVIVYSVVHVLFGSGGLNQIYFWKGSRVSVNNALDEDMSRNC